LSTLTGISISISKGFQHYMSTAQERTKRTSNRAQKKDDKGWLTGRTLWVVGAVLGVIILAPIAMGLLQGDDVPEVLAGVVDEMPDEGRDHVPDGTQVEYESEPPTSGPHYASPAPIDLHRQVIPDEYLVHNLEHGHVVIFYSPSQITDQSAAKISELTREYDGSWDAVVAVPRPEMGNELTLTAWTYKMELDEYDEALIDAFVDHYRGKGPENPVR
jgi:hypothetical protein